MPVMRAFIAVSFHKKQESEYPFVEVIDREKDIRIFISLLFADGAGAG